MPLARAVRPPSRTQVQPYFTSMAVASMSLRTEAQSQVLLGLSEKELQQLALNFGQVNLSSFSNLIGAKGKRQRNVILISQILVVFFSGSLQGQAAASFLIPEEA